MLIKRTGTDRIIDTIVYCILGLLAVTTLLPFLQVITLSLSPADVVSKYGMHIFPTKIDLEGYKKVLHYDMVWVAYGNTIVRTALGTALSVVLLVLGAYPLSKRYFPHRKFWTGVIVFTMYFQGGLIPTYLLVRNLGLYDNIGALILPHSVSAFTLIIVRNFFMTLPNELEESARMDGANDILILLRIILPLSLPIIATVALWSAVWHWNSWFDCMIYIKTEKKYVLQLVLRQILLAGQQVDTNTTSEVYVNTDTMKMATLVVATLPIICVYPFLQKYFVKGMLIGSVKG